MRRAPVVIGGTIAGLAAVLSFHTSTPSLSLPSAVASRPTTRTPVATGSSGPQSGSGSTTSTTGSSSGAGSATTSGGASSTSTTAPSSGKQTVTGSLVNYGYGALSVSVTETGSKITNITIATLDDGGNFRSQSIDQQAIPLLEQQALQAQTANIQGISGATYTSQGFASSLSSALQQLKV